MQPWGACVCKGDTPGYWVSGEEAEMLGQGGVLPPEQALQVHMAPGLFPLPWETQTWAEASSPAQTCLLPRPIPCTDSPLYMTFLNLGRYGTHVPGGPGTESKPGSAPIPERTQATLSLAPCGTNSFLPTSHISITAVAPMPAGPPGRLGPSLLIPRDRPSDPSSNSCSWSC